MTPTSACDRPAGFTLLELLLAMAIIAMAAALLAPSLGGLEARTFDAQVRRAGALLNHARRAAVVSGRPATAAFHADAAAAAEGPRGSAGDWTAEGLRLGFRDGAGRERDADGTVVVAFYPEGGSSGGVLLLAGAGGTARIGIDPFTGRIASERVEP